MILPRTRLLPFMFSMEAVCCVVVGCREQTTRQLCDKHWSMLSIELKREWWRETKYGQEQMGVALRDKINGVFTVLNKRTCQNEN